MNLVDSTCHVWHFLNAQEKENRLLPGGEQVCYRGGRFCVSWEHEAGMGVFRCLQPRQLALRRIRRSQAASPRAAGLRKVSLVDEPGCQCEVSAQRGLVCGLGSSRVKGGHGLQQKASFSSGLGLFNLYFVIYFVLQANKEMNTYAIFLIA